MPDPLIHRVGRYLLLERINVGGMAEVFLAKTSGFDQLLAIKRVLPQLASDSDFIRMFTDEARISALLNHPEIVQVFDFGRDGDTFFLATEFVAGRDLRAVVKRCGEALVEMPVWLGVHVAVKIAGALAYAHQRRDLDGEPLNIVHRDVSSQNIVLSWDGRVKLIDFGIAKSSARKQEATGSGVLKGKLAYMSPEQALGDGVDLRTDIYAVGAVLYLLLTGKSHNSGQTDLELMQNALVPKFAQPRNLNPNISPELEAVVLKALSPERDDRYASATELRQALVDAVPLATDPEVPKRISDFLKRTFERDYAADRRRFAELGQVDTASLPQPPSRKTRLSGLVLRYTPAADPVTDVNQRIIDDESLAGAVTEPIGLSGLSRVADPLADAATVEVQVEFATVQEAATLDQSGEVAIPEPASADERRAYMRLPVELQVSHRDGVRVAKDPSRDISFGGIALASASLLLPGTEREFKLAKPDGIFEIPFVGEVANVRAIDQALPYLTGIRILRIEKEERQRYEALLLQQLATLNAGPSHARMRFDALAFWKEPGTGPAIYGRMLDMGFDGAHLVLSAPAAAGNVGLLTLSSPVDGRLVSVPATVTWSKEHLGEWHARVRFTADAEGQALVGELLRTVMTTARDARDSRVAATPGVVRIGDYACKTPTHVGSHTVVFSGVAVAGTVPGRRVALKRLRTESLKPGTRDAFMAESSFLLGLDHGVAAHTYAALRFADECWQASEWVDGRPLTQVLGAYARSKRHPAVPQVLSVAAEVGKLLAHRSAMARAVGAPVGQLWIKPSGVLITKDGHVKVVDFGRLAWADLPPELTPEADGESSDVFTLGAFIHEALAGAPAFRGSSVDVALPLDELNPEVPAKLAGVIGRALHLKPKKRPQKVSELFSELAKVSPFPTGEDGLARRAELADLKSV